MDDLDVLSIGTALEIIAYDEAVGQYGSHPEMRAEYATRESRERFSHASSRFSSLAVFLGTDQGALHRYPETLTDALKYLRTFGGVERVRAKRRASETIDEIISRLAERTLSTRERFEREGIESIRSIDEADTAAYLALGYALDLSGYFGSRTNLILPLSVDEIEEALFDS